MNPRIFTLEEANALIPELEPLILDLIEKRKLMQKHHDELLVLDLLSGEKVKDDESSESKEYVEKSAELESLILSFEDQILEVNEKGCIVKDIEQGYVDFFAVRDKFLVCFCWHMGEKKIGYWHSVNDNYKSRKKID